MSTTIGKKIRLLRESLGLGRAEFCELTGLAKQTLIGYEQGKTKPGGESLSAIANIWPEYAAYLLTDKFEVSQREPKVDLG